MCALHALPGLVCGCVLGCVPLTPDPSPPFWGRGEDSLRSSGFPARDRPCAAGCLETASAGRGGRRFASREDARGGSSTFIDDRIIRFEVTRAAVPGVDTIPTGSAQPRFACGVLMKVDRRHGLCCTAEWWRRECAGEAGRSRRSGL